MRKVLLLFSLFCVLTALAQSTKDSQILLKTSKKYGEIVDMWITPQSKSDDVRIDWGDGDIKVYHIDPQGFLYNRKVSGASKGVIRILSKLVNFDCSGANVVSFSAEGQDILKELNISNNELDSLYLRDELPALKNINVSKNKLTYHNLNLSGASNLEELNLSENQISMFDASDFAHLKEFNADNNPSLSTVIFPDGSETLESISMSDCDISHFYPISLPNLKVLKLSNGALLDLELANHYPNLSILWVNGNELPEIDVTKLPKLEQFYCNNNMLTKINITQNPLLTHLNCSNNKIDYLNTANNLQLTKLACDNNLLTELTVSHLSSLVDLSCRNNKISYIDTHSNSYLRRFEAANNLFEFFDFTDNANLNYVDVRNNAKLTPCALNFMYISLPALFNPSRRTNLFVAGSNAEHSNTEYATSPDMNWKIDVQGDNSAECGTVKLTQTPAENGTYRLEQSYDKYGQKYREVESEVKVGVPIKVIAKANDGFYYGGIKVNDEMHAKAKWFVVSKDAVVTPLFDYPKRLKLVVKKGTEMNFNLASVYAREDISIDWGNGEPQKIEITSNPTSIEGVASGDTVLIFGNLSVANFESFPGVGWDNKITGIDVSQSPYLTYLSTYMNKIGHLDVSNCPELRYLDCSFGGLTELNLANNPNLETLRCYNNQLTTLDVSKAPYIKFLDVKNNKLSSIELSQNELIEGLSLAGNLFEQVNLSNLVRLKKLEIFGNQLTTLDLQHNPKLTALNAGSNKLTTVDLSNNTEIGVLALPNNQLTSVKGLDNMFNLHYFDLGGNGMTACVLNDIYFALPQYPALTTPMQGFTLLVRGDEGTNFNDCEHAESILATMKGWSINYTGDGSGCDEAYIMIKEVENGQMSLVDLNDKEYHHGDKVKKGATLFIKVTPAAGYKLESLRANGEEVKGNSITLKQSTEFIPQFALINGIADVVTSTAVVANNGQLTVKAENNTALSVLNVQGKVVLKQIVNGTFTTTLPAGVYFVKLGNTTTKVIL